MTKHLTEMDIFDTVYAVEGSDFSLQRIASLINRMNVEHGFWDDKRSPAEAIALMHSELSEALEEFRKSDSKPFYTVEGKPEGWAVELLDAAIRILDFLGSVSDQLPRSIDDMLYVKLVYNNSRPYKHGKQF